ncbi:hypothetical protein NEPTK9_001307 [Candidatus Neptunochlamydia vexilliferae]|uniref:Transposase n=1 Tax=Candidatus Neptunichlamydia vexilliferae TaxID=1651774 RepID=A0ABS0B083_9BACT|nr:hypothetical protein [Candidatus Neptunochlamydia vexilliferae]
MNINSISSPVWVNWKNLSLGMGTVSSITRLAITYLFHIHRHAPIENGRIKEKHKPEKCYTCRLALSLNHVYVSAIEHALDPTFRRLV